MTPSAPVKNGGSENERQTRQPVVESDSERRREHVTRVQVLIRKGPFQVVESRIVTLNSEPPLKGRCEVIDRLSDR